MTIYTSASRTHKHNPCVDGSARTKEALARLGLNMNSLVPMSVVLEQLGVSDTVFSFCEVRKGCEAEADRVLREYMKHILVLTKEYLGFDAWSKGILKRLEGHIRPRILADELTVFMYGISTEPDPVARKALEVYRCMLSEQPNYLCALHAGIALMDGASFLGKHAEVRQALYDKLKELLT